MKKFLLSLLCCMFAVLGMYAETYSYTFEAKQFSANGTVELNGVNWTLEGDGGYWGFDSQNGKGQQFGSSKLPYKTLTLSTSDIVGTISQIEINTAGASSVAATFAVTVGGANFGDEIKLTSAATTYTLEGSASGELVLSYAQTSSKALYIKSIKVVYTTEGGGEEPGTGGGEEPGEGEEPGTGGGEEPGTGGGEEPGEGEEPGTGGETGDLLSVLNGDFETWVDGLPNNWKTASTAGNATLSQSTDAHSGNYSVCVAGTTSSNKRIGYKEMTLKAGTYTMKFYAKAATETGASVRPGYTPVDDANKAGTYVYGDYTNDITTSEWVEVTHEFTLEADTRLSLVIMNAKNPGGNVLIDDFSLETTDGGNTENPGEGEGGGDEPGQGEDPTPEVPSVSALWTSSFANNMGGFTLDNKVIPAELSYVWKYDSYGYMKASAYANSTRYETEAWLVSPVLSLANATDCSLVFDQAANHFTSQENFLAACKVM
ncbi:MAG: carbohydrate binding domain-containing protein, partial [Prevotellamassilia sp.]|nr:carbohydrate binding domain-containing protein [Prevotellamassilia sp.]